MKPEDGLRESLLEAERRQEADDRENAGRSLVDTAACDLDGSGPELESQSTPKKTDELCSRKSPRRGGLPWNRIIAVFLIAIAVTTWVTEIEVTKDALGSRPGQYHNYYAVIWAAHVFSGIVGLALVALLGCFLPVEEGKPTAKDMVCKPSASMLWQTFILSVMVNASGWLWFISITMTDDVVNTVIFQSCCVWCFVISVVVLNERVTVIKSLATLATFAGVAVISKWPCTSPSDTASANDSPNGGGELLGDTLCLCAAILYALYEVLFKLFAEDDEEEHDAQEPRGSSLRSVVVSATFVAYIGLWNLAALWLPLVMGHFMGWVPFTLPEEAVLPAILLDCVLEGAYLAWIILAISMSSPLFVTIGTVLAIPASAFMDWVLHGIDCPALSFVGTGLVVLGFVGVNVAMLVENTRGWPKWL